MVRKRRPPPTVFTSYENFAYLLTELELTVGFGRIKWSAASATAAWRRLDNLTATLRQLVTQLENE
jgi:hypothetical protein